MSSSGERPFDAAASDPKRLLLIGNGSHNLAGEAGPEYLPQVIGFLRETLSR